jgi:hypothetical protein
MAGMMARQRNTFVQTRATDGCATVKGRYAYLRSRTAAIFLSAAAFGMVSPPMATWAQAAAPQPITANQAATARATKLFAKLPLLFEENSGQKDARVRYTARAEGFQVFLSDRDATLVRNDAGRGFALRLSWQGANTVAAPCPEEKNRAKSNYFIGNNSAQWRTGIDNYQRVRIPSLYPGVDLVYYGNHARLEYDLEVAPGGDPSAIRLKMDGAEKLSIDPQSGDLIAENNGSSFRFLKPLLYQPQGDHDREIQGGYQIAADNTVSFAVGDYDHTQPLVIDPIALIKLGKLDEAFEIKNPVINQPYINYSTVFGGETQFMGVAVDSNGYVYLAGSTIRNTVPATSGAFQSTCVLNSVNNNCISYFVAKFDTTQSGAASLLWSSYIGGGDQYLSLAPYQINGSEGYFMPNDLTVDSAGNVYFAGTTGSSSYPTTTNAYSQTPTFDSGKWLTSPVLTKISPDGTELLYSTYFPNKSGFDGYTATYGSLSMFAATVAVDANQVAYVAGMAYPYEVSTDGSSLSTTVATSTENPYIFAIDTTKSGSSGLKYAEYVEMATLSAIAVDSSSNTYILGSEYTSLSSFPGAAQAPPMNGFQTACLAPTTNYCAFLLQLDATGKPSYSTYIGAGLDNTDILSPNGLATEGADTVYVAGWNPGPITQTANGLSAYSSYTGMHGSYNWGGAFLSKIDTTQSGSNSLTYSTWLFGDSEIDELLTSVADYGNGVVAVTGTLDDEDSYPEVLPYAQINPIHQTPSINSTVIGSQTVPWVMILDTLQSNTDALLLFSQLEGIQSPYTVLFDSSANLIVGGYANIGSSRDPFQATTSSYATTGTNSWGSPLFFYKIALQAPPALTITPPGLSFGSVREGQQSATQTLKLTNSGTSAITISTIGFPTDYFQDTTVTNSCSGSVPASSSCYVGVYYLPSSLGLNDATITFTDTDSSSPQTVSVSGTGIASAVLFIYNANAATNADFGSVQMPGSSSAQVTLENTGTDSLNISNIQITGTDITSFSQTNNCPVQVAVSGSCTMTVVFTPAAAGSLSASLSVSDDAPGSPQPFGLTGTGVAPPASVPIVFSETIHVTDTPLLAESVLIPVLETIHTTDSPALATAVMVPVEEEIQVTDAVLPLVSVLLPVQEIVTVSDEISVIAQPIATSTELTVSSNSVDPGQDVTLKATISTTSSATPTGSVSFYDGLTLLQTVALSGDTASYVTTLSADSQHSLTASYSGDVHFSISTSAVVKVTVGALDFTFTPSGSQSATVSAGDSASYQFIVAPLYGSYAGTVSFSATGLPTGANAVFSPASIAANGGQQTLTMTIQTSSSSALIQKMRTGGKFTPVALALLLPFLAGARRWRKLGGRLGWTPLLWVVLLGAAAAIGGCGGTGGGSSQTSYNVTVTATADGLQHSVVVSLTVN